MKGQLTEVILHLVIQANTAGEEVDEICSSDSMWLSVKQNMHVSSTVLLL